MMQHKKYILFAVAVAILGAVLWGSIEVRANHVTIDPNLSLSPNVISFSTVFPGEVHFKPLVVDLSSAFLASPEHDDVEYRIVQKPKPRTDSPEERAYCAANPLDYTRCYPSLCPYLSKTADNNPNPANDTSVPAFHNPDAPTSIAYGRLAKSEGDVKDDWVIDLHTPCFKGQCDQSNSVPAEYQLDPALNGEVFGCDLVVEVTSVSFVKNCPLCEKDQAGNPVTVNVTSNIEINFNTNPPTYLGDPVLLPFFTYNNSGATPNTWKAIFTLGGKALVVKPGVTIRTTQVGAGNNKYAPGIEIRSNCTIYVEGGGSILVNSLNKTAGDIVVQADGNITIDGTVHNEVSGTNDLPGKITIASKCGDVIEGGSGLVRVIGVDNGGNDINILACERGNITTNGLVMSRAKAHTQPVTLHRPNVNVAAFQGNVTINANTPQPLFDEYNFNGTKYDLWGGLLSWVTHNTNPGSIKIQAAKDITVNGHGSDNRQSFGAVAAITGTADSHGGVIDTRSLGGGIIARDRAFDVSGRNKDGSNVAAIRLLAAKAIKFFRLGVSSGFNPVVGASGAGSQSRGGTNTVRAYQESVVNGTAAIISAAVSGTNSVQGSNDLSSCTGVINNGSITPVDANAADNSGVCAQLSPEPIWPGCEVFLPS